MCLKAAEYVTNSVDPYQTPRSAAFDFGLHCLNNRFVQCIWILGVYRGSFNPVVVGTCKLRKTVITVTETVTSKLQLEFILLKTLFRLYYAHLPNFQVLHLKMQRLLRWLLMPNHWLQYMCKPSHNTPSLSHNCTENEGYEQPMLPRYLNKVMFCPITKPNHWIYWF